MKQYFYAMGAILCWASLPSATGSGLQGLSTEELMFYSFTSAAIFLYLQDLVLHRSVKVYIPGIKLSLLGIWGIFIYHYLYYIALSHAPLAEGAILSTTWSFWIVFFSSLLVFKKIKLSILVTAATGMVGAGLVIAAGKDLTFQPDYMFGYTLALCCGLIWSSFSVTLGKIKIAAEPMTIFTIYAALLSGGLFLATGPHQLPSRSALFSAIYLGCVPLGLSFFLWNRALNGGNMVVIGFLSYLTPPLAVLMVAVVHGEMVAPQVLLGMAVIIAASISGKIILEKSEKQIRGENVEYADN
jgi:drug/metabolite transporter (DMT)-like permease